MFFGPLTIPYDAWMMSHAKFKKLFSCLKIGPKVIFSLNSPVILIITRVLPLDVTVKNDFLKEI